MTRPTHATDVGAICVHPPSMSLVSGASGVSAPTPIAIRRIVMPLRLRYPINTVSSPASVTTPSAVVTTTVPATNRGRAPNSSE